MHRASIAQDAGTTVVNDQICQSLFTEGFKEKTADGGCNMLVSLTASG